MGYCLTPPSLEYLLVHTVKLDGDSVRGSDRDRS